MTGKRYRLRLSDAALSDHWIELRFDWLWNFPFIALSLWRAWRRQYGR